MAYGQQHFYLTFGGTMPGPEIWQCGVRYVRQDLNPVVQNTLNVISLSDIFDDIAALGWDSAAPSYKTNADTVLKWAKLAIIDVNGQYAHEPEVFQHVGKAGIAGPARPWNQDALAVSLRSGETLGRANYGRFYLPTPSYARPNAATGISLGEAQQVATGVSLMLGAIQGEISTVGQSVALAVMSSLGPTKFVRQIAVGTVIDTQRRRRNKVDENPQTSPYTDAP